jgi:hypothetical protein
LSDHQRSLRRIARAGLLAAFLGLVAGYVVFYAVYPNMAYPSVGEASVGVVLLVVFVTSVPAGLLTSNLQDGVFQAFLSIPFGVIIASLLAVSPVYTGVVGAQVDVLVYDVIRNGFVIFILVLILDLTGGALGLGLRERFIARAYARSLRVP